MQRKKMVCQKWMRSNSASPRLSNLRVKRWPPPEHVGWRSTEMVLYKIKYTGKLPSDSSEDIVVRGTFRETGDNEEPLTAEAKLTSVRLSLTAQYEAPENASPSRHVYGVGERVKFKIEPLSSEVTLRVVKADSGDYATVYDTFDGEREVSGACERFYTCPATGTTPDVTVTYGQTEYKPAMRVLEPQFIKTPEASGVGSFSLGDVGMGSLVTKNYIGPMTVSFQGVEVFEVPCLSIVQPTGFFATTNYTGAKSHTVDAGAGWAHAIKENNYWTVDSAGREIPYQNWSQGRLIWKIPIGWRRIYEGNSGSAVAKKEDFEKFHDEKSRPLLIGNSESAYCQTYKIEETGLSSVEKFGWKLVCSRWSFSGEVQSLNKEAE